MGHRALVAYRRRDRLYDLRYSHWGGRDLSLVGAITPDTPLGDGTVEADLVVDAVARDRILTGYLDPRVYEHLYLVSPREEYDVEAYRICWLDWGDGRDQGRAAIVETTPDDDRTIETRFRATKTTLGDVVEMGVLSRRAAQVYLESRVCEEDGGIVYTYRGVGEDVEDRYRPPPDYWLPDPQASGREFDDETDRGRSEPFG
ncbi:DUF6735 family protein [Natrarchaeobaculum aegyptiacum]|uniref:Uncharacterized protein n=1 Tax=Natrarchaeobaculum aegyptiacum TaxID=745377 RepID=A0A2Z2HYL7_9EURY|nr:DUF6735 family protein [Natrarchaeobaculum aegyptiacum]ARS90897.1 hypothetical protein B1756_14945 [Natrarchaeobaculum aegyptiacum]